MLRTRTVTVSSPSVGTSVSLTRRSSTSKDVYDAPKPNGNSGVESRLLMPALSAAPRAGCR